MKFNPYSTTIGRERVTHFSMTSGPEDDPLYAIVGRIAVEFGKTEYLVKAMIEKLSRELALRDGLAEEEVSFLEGMLQAEREYTFSACCEYLGRLYIRWEKNENKVAEFEVLVRELRRLSEERNSIIHGCWSSSGADTFLRLRSRYDRKSKSLHQAVERITLSDLQDVYRTINWYRFVLSASIRGEIGSIVPIAAPKPPIKPGRDTVLFLKLLPKAEMCGINLGALSRVLQISTEELEEISRGDRWLDLESWQYGRACAFSEWLGRLLRFHNGDLKRVRQWLSRVHPRLQDTPLSAMQNDERLIKLLMIPLYE